MPVAMAEFAFFVFFVVFFTFIGLAFLFTKKGIIRKIAITCVAAVFFGPIILVMAYDVWEYFLEQIKTLPARKVFYTRCTTAGERVYKTVDNVEGVLLMNVRGRNNDSTGIYWPDAGLPFEYRGDNYIRSFLKEFYSHRFKGPIYKYYFSYVDVKERDEFMRYRIEKKESGKLKKEPSPPELARYAVSFVNHDNTEDRKIGIAGTTITVIDTLTGEKMAERISYAFGPPRLGTTGSRSWNNAITCPKNKEKYQATRNFVTKVIKPKQEY